MKEHEDLQPMERFGRDFGLHIVNATAERLLVCGAGAASCFAIADKGANDRFLGGHRHMRSIGRHLRESQLFNMVDQTTSTTSLSGQRDHEK